MGLSYREAAVRRALTQVGVKEIPRDSNWGPRVSAYLASTGIRFPAAWCMAFVHWCFKEEGLDVGGGASVESFEQWAQQHGDLVKRPLRGDVVCYDWNADDWYDHVGFVVKVLALRWRGKTFVGWVKTVEGNTSSGVFGSQSDGDGVYLRRRWIQSARFARVVGMQP